MIMKKQVNFIGVTLIIVISLLTVLSCKKDEVDNEPQETLEELLIGSWQITDGDYMGTMTFESSYNAKDYFKADTMSGSADLSWQLNGENLTMMIGYVTGDYEEYNEMGVGYTINSTISIVNNELTFDYNGELYIYTRVPDENIIDETDVLGTWQITEGSYKDVVSFELSDKAFNEGVNSFIAESGTGAAKILWDVNGNMILIYYYGLLFGDYTSYNDVNFGDALVMVANVTDNELNFITDESVYTYSKVSEENAIYISDLNETIWQYTSGDYYEILSFNYGESDNINSGASSFIDNGAAGATVDILWIVCGNLLTIDYRSYMMGDYTAQTGISQRDVITYFISLSEDELTINSNGIDYVYTPLPGENIIERSELIGEWQLTDGDYTDTLAFNDGLSTDTFADGTQSGSAEFSWYLNGDMLTMYFDGTFTGDYATYNGIEQYDSYTLSMSIAGNELSIEYDGIIYTYTKVP